MSEHDRIAIIASLLLSGTATMAEQINAAARLLEVACRVARMESALDEIAEDARESERIPERSAMVVAFPGHGPGDAA